MKTLLLSIPLFLLTLLPALAQNARQDKAIKISEKVLTLLQEKKFEEVTAMFDDKVKEQITVERLEQIWNGLGDRLGAFKKSEGITAAEEKGYLTTINKCRFEKSLIGLKLAFNNTDQINGFFFVPAP